MAAYLAFYLPGIAGRQSTPSLIYTDMAKTVVFDPR